MPCAERASGVSWPLQVDLQERLARPELAAAVPSLLEGVEGPLRLWPTPCLHAGLSGCSGKVQEQVQQPQDVGGDLAVKDTFESLLTVEVESEAICVALSHSHSIVETLCPALFLRTCSFCERGDLQLDQSVQLGTLRLMRPCSLVGGHVTCVQ